MHLRIWTFVVHFFHNALFLFCFFPKTKWKLLNISDILTLNKVKDSLKEPFKGRAYDAGLQASIRFRRHAGNLTLQKSKQIVFLKEKKKEFTKLSTWETLLTSPALLAWPLPRLTSYISVQSRPQRSKITQTFWGLLYSSFGEKFNATGFVVFQLLKSHNNKARARHFQVLAFQTMHLFGINLTEDPIEQLEFFDDPIENDADKERIKFRSTIRFWCSPSVRYYDQTAYILSS